MQQIIQGDCLEVMKQWPDNHFDLVLTDPPYGINAGGVLAKNYHLDNYGAAKRTNYGGGTWDNFTPSQEYFDEMIRISKKQVIFGAQYFADKLPVSGKWIVWDKKESDLMGNSFSDCELAWTSEAGATRIVRYLWNGMIQKNMKDKDQRVHPTQKPVSVMRTLIQWFSDDGQTIILDPFMGSGTTLRAAKDLGRDCIGIELDPKYCEIAEQRLRQQVLL